MKSISMPMFSPETIRSKDNEATLPQQPARQKNANRRDRVWIMSKRLVNRSSKVGLKSA
jgi:hypothetical protein